MAITKENDEHLADEIGARDEPVRNQGDITALLLAHGSGDESAFNQLLEIVYAKLRSVARGQLRKVPSPNQTLDTHSLIHELYLKLVDQTQIPYRDREHFFAVAAQAMRHILIDLARRRSAVKRGGEQVRVDFDAAHLTIDDQAPVLLEIHKALQSLELHSPRMVRVVECRFFAGLNEEETARALGIARRTAQRDWVKAKGWLRRTLETTA